MALVTQTAPSAAAIESGPRPTGIVATMRFVRGSIRVTVSPRSDVTQTAPLPAAIAFGMNGRWISAATRRVFGSRRQTTRS